MNRAEGKASFALSKEDRRLGEFGTHGHEGLRFVSSSTKVLIYRNLETGVLFFANLLSFILLFSLVHLLGSISPFKLFVFLHLLSLSNLS